MTSYVLDTDTLSLLQRGNATVGARFSRYDADEVATTIVSVEEQLSGWYTLLRRAKTTMGLVPVYQRMSDTLRFLSALPVPLRRRLPAPTISFAGLGHAGAEWTFA